MTSVSHRFTGLAATETGRTRQIAKAFHGMAEDMKTRAVASADCDEPKTLAQAKRVIASLRNKIAEYEDLLNEIRAEANSDAPTPAVTSSKSWTTKTVAEKSGVAISTIIRNVDKLGGWQLQSGDWMFPVGTTYGRRRKSK